MILEVIYSSQSPDITFEEHSTVNIANLFSLDSKTCPKQICVITCSIVIHFGNFEGITFSKSAGGFLARHVLPVARQIRCVPIRSWIFYMKQQEDKGN